MSFACGHIANCWLDAIAHGGRLDHGVMLLSKPYRKSELASVARLALGDAAAEKLESGLSPSLVHQSELRCGGNPQAFKRPLEVKNFCLSQSPALAIRLHQGHFGGARSLAGGGEADRGPDAADAVQMAVGFGDMLDNAVTAAGHVVGRDDCLCDLALERGCKAVPYPGQAGFELIGVHGALLVPLHQASASDLNR
jgi:hypothetical protein